MIMAVKEVVIISDFRKVITIDECGWVMRRQDEGFFDDSTVCTIQGA